ncbi:MAG: alpha/beta hydrolase [Hyphomonadaceae bacterium]|nr:alpha/beta hydrolase [Hyphomonadaceae bacterium]
MSALLIASACVTPTWRTPERLDFFDLERQRSIPVIIYGADDNPRPLAVLSSGYGAPPDAYSFLASHLAARGYVVAAIQHDLEGDEAPASSGDIATLRRPIWERGAANIAFVIEALRERRLASAEKVLLIGHSQGGDISMLYAETRPADLAAVFSLGSAGKSLDRIVHKLTESVRGIRMRRSSRPIAVRR